jgi:hypothetical protein
MPGRLPVALLCTFHAVRHAAVNTTTSLLTTLHVPPIHTAIYLFLLLFPCISSLCHSSPATILTTLARTSRIGTERHLFCIEDPFVLSHDLGRTCHRDGVDQMKAEFKRAWQVGGGEGGVRGCV